MFGVLALASEKTGLLGKKWGEMSVRTRIKTMEKFLIFLLLFSMGVTLVSAVNGVSDGNPFISVADIVFIYFILKVSLSIIGGQVKPGLEFGPLPNNIVIGLFYPYVIFSLSLASLILYQETSEISLLLVGGVGGIIGMKDVGLDYDE